VKPNDENGNLPAAERPFRVLIIAGSDRRQYNCPGVDSKSRTMMLRVAARSTKERCRFDMLDRDHDNGEDRHASATLPQWRT
jgi:hypothetical protein